MLCLLGELPLLRDRGGQVSARPGAAAANRRFTGFLGLASLC
jgi:hypothetical protein